MSAPRMPEMSRVTLLNEEAATNAGFSEDRQYRYWLSRHWDASLPPLVVIGLNPSTADENTDDPTIRRCVDYAKRWGLGGLVMLNLFAFRATDPRVMKQARDPVGGLNNSTLIELTKNGETVLAAWGANGNYLNRSADVVRMLTKCGVKLACLGLTKAGEPKHPLYIRADEQMRGLVA